MVAGHFRPLAISCERTFEAQRAHLAFFSVRYAALLSAHTYRAVCTMMAREENRPPEVGASRTTRPPWLCTVCMARRMLYGVDASWIGTRG
jgi:hypothetical protein